MEKNKKDQSVGNWTIKKEVSLGDLIAFVMAFVSVVYAYTTLDKRLAILEDRQDQQENVDARQDTDSSAAIIEVNKKLDKMDAKIDRLIEKRN